MKKNIFFFILLIGIVGCKHESELVNLEINTENKDYSKFYTQQDTILIITEIKDTLKISKKEFNGYIDEHPEFFEEFPYNPDRTYYSSQNDKKLEFESEVGQDYYYLLYAYFLKQKNGVQDYYEQRQKLITIYSNINSLFRHFEYGGTYFGHQSRRILGYAEYSIYLLTVIGNDYSKTYDISNQKKLYIESLRQLIDDESKIDFETLEIEKIERSKKLNKIVDELDVLISDNFYLKQAQEFHYNNYKYF